MRAVALFVIVARLLVAGAAGWILYTQGHPYWALTAVIMLGFFDMRYREEGDI